MRDEAQWNSVVPNGMGPGGTERKSVRQGGIGRDRAEPLRMGKKGLGTGRNSVKLKLNEPENQKGAYPENSHIVFCYSK